jgi:UDPglucose 6-dehydrogenase
MKLAVIGTGYVGLVAGAGFSDFSNDVTCVDIDEERVRTLERGEIPFYEPNLDALVRRNLDHGRLQFTTDTATAVAGAEAVFLTVGTPSTEAGEADLSYLEAAAREVGSALTGWAVIITKSTVPVGTAEHLRGIIAKHTKHEFSVASNPEFLKEGDAVNDFMKPQRVVIGVDDERSLGVLKKLYAPLLRLSDRMHVMDIASAELAKYAANAMLATRISFMNELAGLCERTGGDIENIRRAMGADDRIGRKFLFAGAGFGGSCFPKDLRALVHTGRRFGLEMGIVDAANRANERQKRVLGERVLAHFGADLTGKRIGLWGLAFKPNTDDIREAPALTLAGQLLDAGAEVVAYDPAGSDNAAAHFAGTVAIADDMYAVAEGSDALVLVTEWHPFRHPDFKRMHHLMRAPVLFDGRNVWDRDEVRELGFTYYGIGRGAPLPARD